MYRRSQVVSKFSCEIQYLREKPIFASEWGSYSVSSYDSILGGAARTVSQANGSVEKIWIHCVPAYPELRTTCSSYYPTTA